MLQNNKLAALRSMLWQMEVEVGLDALPQSQKDVFYAACLVADEDRCAHSNGFRSHPMLAQMPRPTFYRALKQLMEAGLLVPAGLRRDGRYFIKR